MITPSFSLTATERVLPNLALDFTTASLDPRVTFTRTTGASNPATYVASNGYITSATNNQPRFDYDPVTLACRGLLVEESRANLISSSNGFTNATYWITNGAPTVLANQVASPDGTTNAATIEVSGSSHGHGVYSATTYAAGTYTVSLYFKPVSGNFVMRLGFGVYSSTINMNTLAIVNGTSSVGSVQQGPNGFYRFIVTVTTVSSSALNIYNMGSNTGKIAIYGAQIEPGTFATSYIPTTGSAATRNADVATMTGTNFSDWYNASEGTLVAKFVGNAPAQSTISTIFSLNNNGTGSNRIDLLMYSTGVNADYIDSAGTTIANMGSSVYAANTVLTNAFAYKTNSFAQSVNAGTINTDISGTVNATITRANIGNLVGQYFLNGTIQKINYYPQRVINAQVQAFSKG